MKIDRPNDELTEREKAIIDAAHVIFTALCESVQRNVIAWRSSEDFLIRLHFAEHALINSGCGDDTAHEKMCLIHIKCAVANKMNDNLKTAAFEAAQNILGDGPAFHALVGPHRNNIPVNIVERARSATMTYIDTISSSICETVDTTVAANACACGDPKCNARDPSRPSTGH